MKLRRFAARLFGLDVAKPQPVRIPPADSLRQASNDALIILDAIYAGEPWSRSAFTGRMSQPRWHAATELLRSAGIVDRKGRYLFDPARNQEIAQVLVRNVENQEREKRKKHKGRNFVSPY